MTCVCGECAVCMNEDSERVSTGDDLYLCIRPKHARHNMHARPLTRSRSGCAERGLSCHSQMLHSSPEVRLCPLQQRTLAESDHIP